MGSLRNYSAISTKIRAMGSKLLQYEDFEKLADMESIPQAAEYLSRISAYQSVLSDPVLAGIELSAIHRGELERLLTGVFFYDFAKLYRFSDQSQKKLLKLYFRKYEIAEIKHAIRRVFRCGDESQSQAAFGEFFQRFTDIRPKELSEAQTVQELLNALENTDYRGVFERTGVLEKKSLLDCDLVLDLFYFTEFWKQKNKILNKKECRLLEESLGSDIDLLNMTWIYRARKYYKVSDVAVYGLLIPVKYRLRSGDIRDMVAAQDLEALKQAIDATYYGHKFKSLDLGELENFYREFMKKVYGNERRRSPWSIAVITGYLYDREEEVRKLMTVLEGVRYGLPKDETLAYIKA